ncbi:MULTISPECIES: sugar ABC transporter permease [unclassified Streptomyces]|uniref:Sugar ABC transporter permease n=1 Tax=Streptomyces johnsoniae TaxID=3075532 RepID=A0ABU2SBR0_9ACTN|nr:MULTISPECIES: sugar ABC transporter permease [unclassified Streptomyces]MDT0445535.1 sugar ABC transporter permease [Streptomyces sp. DSM 41886]ONK13991.1 Lactose transport system permease protein LacF [Streptomyces sp. MP131-18]
MTSLSTRPDGKRRQLAPYAFIAPFYVLYGLFMIVPIGAGVYLSMTEWVGLGTPEFVGLDNFANLARDTSFHKALGNSMIFVLISVLIVVPASLLIAQALNTRGLRARDLFRVTFFIPMVLSPIVIALVYSLLLDRDYGLVNSVLRALFGAGTTDWLGDPTLAKVSVGFVLLWRWVGYLTIFFLAALQAVPRERYEAAELDGAGPWRTFTAVTLPGIRPVTAFVVVTSFIGSAQLFDEPFLITGGGPGEETLTVAMFVYRAAFDRQQFGYAAAAGLVLFVIVFGISQILNRLLSIGRTS